MDCGSDGGVVAFVSFGGAKDEKFKVEEEPPKD